MSLNDLHPLLNLVNVEPCPPWTFSGQGRCAAKLHKWRMGKKRINVSAVPYRVLTVTDIVEFCVVSRSADGDGCSGCSAPMAMLMGIPLQHDGWGVHPL